MPYARTDLGYDHDRVWLSYWADEYHQHQWSYISLSLKIMGFWYGVEIEVEIYFEFDGVELDHWWWTDVTVTEYQ